MNIIIRNGHVIDPANGVDEVRDLYIAGGMISALPPKEDDAEVIDASGLYVSTGWIDFHVHMFEAGGGFGIAPDLFPAYGVTAAVEPGSAGALNYPYFHNTAVVNSHIPVKALLSISADGMTRSHELTYDRIVIDTEAMEDCFRRYGDELLGIKLLYGTNFTGPVGDSVLKTARELCDRFGKMLVVHTTRPHIPVEEIMSYLKKGDVYCHIFQGFDETILDENGRVKPGILAGKARGVYVDAANGNFNFAIEVARKSIAQGFLPDIISSDITSMSYNRHGYVHCLPYVMSKYLGLGMGLPEIIAAVTRTPALAMKSPELGTLKEGAPASVTLFRVLDRPSKSLDRVGGSLTSPQTIVPMATIVGGNILYRQVTL